MRLVPAGAIVLTLAAIAPCWAKPPAKVLPSAGVIKEFPTMQFEATTHFALVNAIVAALNMQQTRPSHTLPPVTAAEVLCACGVAFRPVFVWSPGHGDEFLSRNDLDTIFGVEGYECNPLPHWDSAPELPELKIVWQRAVSSVNIESPLLVAGMTPDKPWQWGLIGAYRTDGHRQFLSARGPEDPAPIEVPVPQVRLISFRPQGDRLLDRPLLRAVLARAVEEADAPTALRAPVEAVGPTAWAKWAAVLRDDARFSGQDAAKLAQEAACNDALLALTADARAAAGSYLMSACRFAPKRIYEIRVASGVYDHTAYDLSKFAPKKGEDRAKLIATAEWRAKLAAVLDESAARDDEAIGYLRKVLVSLPEAK